MKKHNRKYKDSVFVDFFSEDKTAKENFLSLYNALHGTSYQSAAILRNIRLKQVVYLSFANDVSYLVDDKIIILAEHQSTVNPNMPLRCLEYITRLYEQLQSPRERYSRTLKKIPIPEFYVFYNGKEHFETKQTLKLSDAFIAQTATPKLELIVQVLNINYDKGDPVVKNCKPLKEYSLFVETVRRRTAIDKEGGFEAAIKECIQNNILKDYLMRKSREVINMLLAEYDYDTDIAVQREEAGKIAFAEGKSLGLAEGEARGKSLGLAEGKSLGSRQAKLETAAAFKRLGFDIDKIAEGTGLSCEEVEKL